MREATVLGEPVNCPITLSTPATKGGDYGYDARRMGLTCLFVIGVKSRFLIDSELGRFGILDRLI